MTAAEIFSQRSFAECKSMMCSSLMVFESRNFSQVGSTTDIQKDKTHSESVLFWLGLTTELAL